MTLKDLVASGTVYFMTHRPDAYCQYGALMAIVDSVSTAVLAVRGDQSCSNLTAVHDSVQYHDCVAHS